MTNTQALKQVDSMLAQMRALTRTAQGAPEAGRPGALAGDGPAAAPVPGSSSGAFAAELARSLNRVSHTENAAYSQARAFELGAPDVSLSNVMIDLQKANLSLQATVQVRNRFVEAYKEIANLAI